MFVRREAWALEAAEGAFGPTMAAYADAVRTMRARPMSDPTSWSYQAAVHGTFTTPAPPGAPWNTCQHRNWFFLPWHRMYLHYFERIVRKAVTDAGGPADFALPYWNYDTSPPGNTLPSVFRTPTLPDGSANPLFLASPRRNKDLVDGGRVPAAAASSSAAMALTDFTAPSPLPSFGGTAGGAGSLESAPHNPMHPTIGGRLQGSGTCGGRLMAQPRCAGLDPLFWLHHANIDRLWTAWLALGEGRANPTTPNWLQRKFTFHDETGARVSLSCADVLDSGTQLGYVYDNATVPRPDRSETARPSRPLELVAAGKEPLMLAGAASLPLLPVAGQRPFDVAGEDGNPVILTIEDIRAGRDPGIVYALHLTADSERRPIGTISFFAIETGAHDHHGHNGHNGHNGVRYSYYVTEAVRDLKLRNLWGEAPLAVTFEPVRVSPPGGWEPSETTEAEKPPAVHIGRVNLFTV